MTAVYFKLSLAFLYIIQLVQVFALENDTSCGQGQSADPVCLREKFKVCMKDRVNQQGQIVSPAHECLKLCENGLGPNSKAIIDCQDEHHASKALQKLKQIECVVSESQQQVNFQQHPIGDLYQVNISEVLKYEMDKSVIGNAVSLKAYEKCRKNCLKPAKIPKKKTKKAVKQPKAAKQPKDLSFHQCYQQVYSRPYDPMKGNKLASKLCSQKLKTDKYLLTSKLAECLQSALGSGGMQPHQVNISGEFNSDEQ